MLCTRGFESLSRRYNFLYRGLTSLYQRSYGVMVSTGDSKSHDPGSTPGRTSLFCIKKNLEGWDRTTDLRNYSPPLCLLSYFEFIIWQKCHLLGSNQGPSDLQSDALPTELKRRLIYGTQITSTYGLVGYDVRLTRGRSPVRSWVGVFYGSLAQMVEHWSNKPRVMGSIPIGTILLIILFYLSANSF